MDILSILGDVVSPYYSGSNIYYSSPGINSLSVLSNSISNLFSLAAAILVIIGTWKILEKAGEQGWKALIPFYNKYTMYKTFWKKKWFWVQFIPAAVLVPIITILFVASIVGFISATNSYSSDAPIMAIISIAIAIFLTIAISIYSYVFSIILNVKIAKAFGKSGGFAVGLILLAPVFYMILGCGKDKYQKPEEVKKPGETKEAKDA